MKIALVTINYCSYYGQYCNLEMVQRQIEIKTLHCTLHCIMFRFCILRQVC